jgi:hypothetical protein
MTNSLSPGCCGCCNVVDLSPNAEWDGWTDPPPADDVGVIAAGHTTSIAHSRPTGNWTVDVQVIEARPANGTRIKVGDIEAVINSETFNHLIRLRVGNCVTLVRPFGFWLRYQQTTITVGEILKRRKRVEVWASDPSVKSPTPTLLGSACYDFDIEDPGTYEAPDLVAIEITAGSNEITIGKVRAGDTSTDGANCPPVVCVATPCESGGPLRYIATNPRCVLSGWQLLWLTYRYQGMYQGSSGPDGPIDISQALTWDFSGLNGTYALTLHYGLLALNSLQTQEAIELAMTRGLCPEEASLYSWRFPSVNISATDSYVIGPPDDGVNFRTPFQNYVSPQIASYFNAPWQQSGTPQPTVAWSIGGNPPRMAERPYSAGLSASFRPLLGLMPDGILALIDGPNFPAAIPFASCAPIDYSAISHTHDINATQFYSASTGLLSNPGFHMRTFTSNVATMTRHLLIDYVEI